MWKKLKSKYNAVNFIFFNNQFASYSKSSLVKFYSIKLFKLISKVVLINDLSLIILYIFPISVSQQLIKYKFVLQIILNFAIIYKHKYFF